MKKMPVCGTLVPSSVTMLLGLAISAFSSLKALPAIRLPKNRLITWAHSLTAVGYDAAVVTWKYSILDSADHVAPLSLMAPSKRDMAAALVSTQMTHLRQAYYTCEPVRQESKKEELHQSWQKPLEQRLQCTETWNNRKYRRWTVIVLLASIRNFLQE